MSDNNAASETHLALQFFGFQSIVWFLRFFHSALQKVLSHAAMILSFLFFNFEHFNYILQHTQGKTSLQ